MDRKDKQIFSGMVIFLGLFIMIFSTPFFVEFIGIAVFITFMGFVILMVGLYNLLKTLR